MNYPPMNRKSLKEFGVQLFALSMAIAALLYFLFHKETGATVFASLGSISLLLSFIYPPLLIPLFKGLWIFGKVMGWVNTRILIFLIFFAILFPLKIVLRLFGKKPIPLSFEPQAPTYWSDHDPKQSERHKKLF